MIIAEIANVSMSDGSIGTMWAVMQMWNGMYCIRSMFTSLEEAEAEAEEMDKLEANFIADTSKRDAITHRALAKSISHEYQLEMLNEADAWFSGQKDSSIEEIWAGLIDIAQLPSRGVRACGGCGLDNTPAALYRLLWLAHPDNIGFVDMYKQPLFVLASRCRQFFVEVCTWKYELSLRFYCVHEHHVSYHLDGIFAGNPSSNNDQYCTSEIGRRWFNFVQKSIEASHMIYGGNNFKV